MQIAKRSELHTFQVMPQRWIVERSFAWLEKNRRLWNNCERWINTSLQFIHLAFRLYCLKDFEHVLTSLGSVFIFLTELGTSAWEQSRSSYSSAARICRVGRQVKHRVEMLAR